MTTAQFSTEAQRVRDPRANGFVNPAHLRNLEVMPFNFTQSGAGNAGSTATLIVLQKGRYRLFPHMSRLYHSAFGASRTLDIGLSAYTQEDGTTVALADNRFDNDINVAAATATANGIVLGSSLAAADTAGIDVNVGGTSNTDGLGIIATVAGGTIPDGAVLRGFIVVSTIP